MTILHASDERVEFLTAVATRCYLRTPYGDEVGEFLTATRIIELVGASVKRPLSPKKVAFAMNRLGFEQRRTHAARGWNVIILTGNDIREAQRLNAHRCVED